MRPAVVIAAALAVTGAAAADPHPAAADAPPQGIVHVRVAPGTTLREHGYQLYSANCASCHGIAGSGVEAPQRGAGAQLGQGPPLRGVGALAADFYLRTGYMPLGHPGDQPWRNRVLFSEREVKALVAYVASLGPGPAIPRPHAERGRVATGFLLFTDHCAGCHQVAAQGGFVTGARVPQLNQSTPVQVAEAVRTGPYLMPRFSKRQISDRDLDSIIAYVEYAKHPRDSGGWSIGRVGPVPEGLVAWLIGGAALVATCLLIGKRLRS